MMKEPLYELSGLTNKLSVYEDKVVIAYPCTQEEATSLHISDILSVHYRKAGLLKGALHFSHNNQQPPKENVVEFSHGENDAAEEIYIFLAGALKRIKPSLSHNNANASYNAHR